MIFCFNLEVHAFRYPRGYENEGLGGVYESELETPSPQINPPHYLPVPYARNRSLD